MSIAGSRSVQGVQVRDKGVDVEEARSSIVASNQRWPHFSADLISYD